MEEPGFDEAAFSNTEDVVLRRPGRPSSAQKAQFLDLLNQGMPRDGAARLVGSTASRMRSEARRDSTFGRWVAAAEEAGQASRPDTIRGALHEVALGHLLGSKDEHPKAFEALRMLAEAHLPELAYKRNKQVTHGQDKPFEILVGQRVPESLLEQLSEEEFAKVVEAVRMLEEGQARTELRAIEGGS